MATAIEAGMNYWHYPREVTPTEGPASPRPAEPPGLPTPKAEPAVPQELVQPGVASSSRPAAGQTEFFRMDSGPEAAQNAGTGRQPPQDGTGFAGINMLEGRTGVRAERDAREHVNQDGNRRASVFRTF